MATNLIGPITAKRQTEPIQEDWPQVIERLKQEIATLKLQNGLLRSDVEKWKRRALAANKDRARMEWKELQRIEEAAKEIPV